MSRDLGGSPGAPQDLGRRRLVWRRPPARLGNLPRRSSEDSRKVFGRSSEGFRKVFGRSPKGPGKVFWRSSEDIRGVCGKFPGDLPKISARFREAFRKVFGASLQALRKVSGNFPDDVRKVCQRFPEGVGKVCARLAQSDRAAAGAAQHENGAHRRKHRVRRFRGWWAINRDNGSRVSRGATTAVVAEVDEDCPPGGEGAYHENKARRSGDLRKVFGKC